MLVARNKKKNMFAVPDIAKQHGHVVNYAPQYHPDLRSIEGICVNFREKVATRTSKKTEGLIEPPGHPLVIIKIGSLVPNLQKCIIKY